MVTPTVTPTAPVTKAARRAVILVGNPAAPYSRALRIGRTLVAAGFAVEIAAVADDSVPDRELDGAIVIRRYRPRGSVTRTFGRSESRAHRKGLIGGLSRLARAVYRWVRWPHTVRGWWTTLATELTPADLYHACGSLTIAPALAARRRHPIGPSGAPAVVIYDAVDSVFDSNNVLDMPAPIKAVNRRREDRWARSADAIVTINDDLAEMLATRWGVARPTVVPNYPEAPPARPPGSPPADLIRAELRLPPTTRVVLFQGRIGPHRGLEAAAEAVLLVPDTVLVLLGFGAGYEASLARDQEPRYIGRHWTLPARHPDELLDWTASADVALLPYPPVSLNARLSLPNKFWEALAAGTPVVVSSGIELVTALVRDLDLGVVADSTDPEPLAKAITSVLDRSAEERAAWRARIASIAAKQFTWPVAAAAYRDLVDRLGTDGPLRAVSTRTASPR